MECVKYYMKFGKYCGYIIFPNSYFYFFAAEERISTEYGTNRDFALGIIRTSTELIEVTQDEFTRTYEHFQKLFQRIIDNATNEFSVPSQAQNAHAVY